MPLLMRTGNLTGRISFHDRDKRPKGDAAMQQGSHGAYGFVASMDHIGGGHSRMVGAAKKRKPAGRAKEDSKARGPEWTSGLKHLYDSVVEEPIPDAFKDLLAKLDGTK